MGTRGTTGSTTSTGAAETAMGSGAASSISMPISGPASREISGSGARAMGGAGTATPPLIGGSKPISSMPNSGIEGAALALGYETACRCLASISDASLPSTSRRLGSAFWIFLRTEMALAAKPSRAYSSARGSSTSAASRPFPAMISTSASCIRRRGSAFWPLIWILISSIAFE